MVVMSDWQRLADYLRSAMDRQGIGSQRELADVAGVSPRTVGDLLRGVPRKWIPTTMPAVERAVGWQPGDARRILDGGQPTYDEPDTFDDALRVVETLTDAHKREVIRYARYLQARDERGEDAG